VADIVEGEGPYDDWIGPPPEPVAAKPRGNRKPPPQNDPNDPSPHPDQYEMQRRLEYIMDLVVLGYSKVEIRRDLATEKPKWELSDRTFERYWSKIQTQLKADADRKRQPEVAKAIKRNELVFRKAMARTVSVGEKEVHDPDLRAALRANLQNSRLLGLDAPKVIQHGSDPDNPLPSPVTNVNAAVSITFMESDE